MMMMIGTANENRSSTLEGIDAWEFNEWRENIWRTAPGSRVKRPDVLPGDKSSV